jgi:hypothetical protein
MGGTTGYDSCVARYNGNGSLDVTFDGDGIATTDTAPGTNDDYSYAIAQVDGKLITAGECDMGATTYDTCLNVYDDAGTMGQYQNTVSDWDTAGTGMFGACLRSTSGTPTWTANATCPTTDGAYWNAVPPTATTIATAATTVVNATANLRFGIRIDPTQTPGAYLAPLTFTVTAP